MMRERGEKTSRPWEPERYRQDAQSPAAKLPEGDVVFCLLDTVPPLELRRCYAPYEHATRGALPYDPAMRVCLWLSAYGVGVFASRNRYRTRASMAWVAGWLLLLACTASHAAERYAIALQQSQVQFKAYSVFAKPVGQFHTFSGDILADAQQLSMSQVRLVIEARSIDTDNAKRDTHLRSEDFLFVEKYPTLTFVSTAITGAGTTYTVQGDLTMHGVTQRLTIPVTVEQHQNDIVVRGNVSLSRKAFGITYNAFFNPVQDNVDVLFTIVGVKP